MSAEINVYDDATHIYDYVSGRVMLRIELDALKWYFFAWEVPPAPNYPWASRMVDRRRFASIEEAQVYALAESVRYGWSVVSVSEVGGAA